MSTDARLSTGLPGHPKTKKLVRRLGPGAGWSLVCLILWARSNRPDGDLSGMTSEDIELAADWNGDNDALVRELASVGFLDGDASAYQLHDWAEHQPWAAGSEARSEKARWAALCRRHGRSEAARLMPEYAARLLQEQPEQDGSLPDAGDGLPLAESGTAPSPNPSPNPSPSPRAEDSSPQLSLAGTPEQPAPAKPTRAERIRQIAEEARAAYNAILAKPHGELSACTVLNKPRIKAVEKALPTVRQLCQMLFGSERVTPEFWKLYFETAADDDFHAGRQQGGVGHENWKPDFEYLLREGVIAKLADKALSGVAQ